MNVPSNETTALPSAPTVPARGGGVLKPLLAGLVLAVILAWTLLSFALSLLFMLGLFFFMLFGLIIGATMFRFGGSARPMAKSSVTAMTAIVSLVCWSVAVYKECLEFPEDFVDSAIKSKRVYVPKNGYDEVRAELHGFIVEYLKTNYPPGGVRGYLKLAATGSPIEVDLPSQPRPVSIPPRAAAWVWWTRVILALVLLYVAIYSVTAGLVKASDGPQERTGEESPPPARASG